MKARLPQGYGGGNSNMNSLVKQAQKVQEDMAIAQEELNLREYSTTVGGGVVEVSVSGKKEITKLILKPEIVDPDDIDMLQDLIISAVNEVLRKMEADSEETLGGITGALNLPGVL